MSTCKECKGVSHLHRYTCSHHPKNNTVTIQRNTTTGAQDAWCTIDGYTHDFKIVTNINLGCFIVTDESSNNPAVYQSMDQVHDYIVKRTAYLAEYRGDSA